MIIKRNCLINIISATLQTCLSLVSWSHDIKIDINTTNTCCLSGEIYQLHFRLCKLPSNLSFKPGQIPKLKCFSSRLAVVIVQCINPMRHVENALLQLYLSDQQWYCLIRCDLFEMFDSVVNIPAAYSSVEDIRIFNKSSRNAMAFFWSKEWTNIW